MRSLFLRIFLYFLLLIVLVSTAVIVLTYFRDREFPLLEHQGFARQAITEYGRDAIRAFEQEGTTSFDRYAEKLQRETGVRLLLFDHDCMPLTQKRVPRRMQQMAHRAKHSGEVVFPMRGARNGLAAMVKGDSDQPYLVAINLPNQPPTRNLIKGITHGFLGWRLVLLLLITALVCYFLARSLTAPIGRLRLATRKFAAGELATRIGDEVKGNNEIAELAHDFDEMAEKIETLVGRQKDLLRDISHELRSPLTRMGIALELARQQKSNAAQNKSLNRIELEAERMNIMIGQLLNLARLENSNGELEFKSFDLSKLLTELVEDANYEAKSRQCRVVFTAPETINYPGVENLLSQALENIIRNAIHYTATNTDVTVAMKENDSTLTIQISDQGTGVPETALTKLFEPFYRVADARDRQSGGTGIGLAIAERAIKLHGGTITAKNRSNSGLMIEINLPKK
ncbi:MAG: HAMP domain-containing protein [Desulfuromonadales bacterium]|nr:HAMP domain-containing protein [Desulfuromonadales bacterium]